MTEVVRILGLFVVNEIQMIFFDYYTLQKVQDNPE